MNANNKRKYILKWNKFQQQYEKYFEKKFATALQLQLKSFIKHRHDQSCLSICGFLQNIQPIKDETWFANWTKAYDYPILAFRNRTGQSILKKKLKGSFFSSIKFYLERLKK